MCVEHNCIVAVYSRAEPYTPFYDLSHMHLICTICKFIWHIAILSPFVNQAIFLGSFRGYSSASNCCHNLHPFHLQVVYPNRIVQNRCMHVVWPSRRSRAAQGHFPSSKEPQQNAELTHDALVLWFTKGIISCRWLLSHIFQHWAFLHF